MKRGHHQDPIDLEKKIKDIMKKSYAKEFVNLDKKNKLFEAHNLKSWHEEKQNI